MPRSWNSISKVLSATARRCRIRYFPLTLEATLIWTGVAVLAQALMLRGTPGNRVGAAE